MARYLVTELDIPSNKKTILAEFDSEEIAINYINGKIDVDGTKAYSVFYASELYRVRDGVSNTYGVRVK